DDVGDHLDAALGEHAVALGSGRAVGALGDEPALEPLGDRAGDLAAERGGNAEVAGDVPEIRLGDLLRLRVAGHRAPEVRRIVVDVGGQVLHVEAGRAVDGAARVVDGEELRPQAAEDLRRVRPDVAETLQDEGRAGGRRPPVGEPFLDTVGEALTGGAHAAFGAADARVLPG